MKKLSKLLMIIVMTFLFVVRISALTVKSTGDNYSVQGFINGEKPEGLKYINTDGSKGNITWTEADKYYIFESTDSKALFCMVPENEISIEYVEGTVEGETIATSCAIVMGLKGSYSGIDKITPDDLKKINAGANFDDPSYVAAYKHVQNYLWAYRYYRGNDCSTTYTYESDKKTNKETYEAGKITLGFENNDNKLTLNAAGTHYVSQKINVKITDFEEYYGYSVKLESNGSTGFLPSGAYVSTKPGGNSIGNNTIESSELYVNVPVGSVSRAMNFKITLTLEYLSGRTTTTTTKTTVSPKLTSYKANNNTSNDTRQTIATLVTTFKDEESEKKTDEYDNTSQSITAISEVANIKIIKKNSENNSFVEGAKFSLTKQDGSAARKIDGKTIGTLTTTNNGEIVIDNILPGKYILKETNPATGYLKQSENCSFEVTVASGTTKVTMISKNLKNYSVSGNTITVKNQPVKQTFIKKAIVDSKETVLTGSHIVIKNSSGKIVQEFDSKTTANEFYLESGSYTLEETKAPEGYKKIDTVFKFTVEKNGNISPADKTSKIFTTSNNNIILYNDALYQTFSKKTFDKNGNEKFLTGAHIVIKDEKGNIIQEFDSLNESTKLSLKAGKYTLQETISPAGYENIETIFEFEIDEVGNVIPKDKTSKVFTANDNNIVLYNSAIYQVFSKKDIANDEELEGAHIVIKDEKDNIVLEFDSKKEPTVFYLEAGKYTLEETVSPEGYEKIETVFNFTVDKDGKVKITTDSDNIKAKDNTIILYNEVPIPDTGISTKTIYIVLASILLIGGGVLIYFGVKKRKAESI